VSDHSFSNSLITISIRTSKIIKLHTLTGTTLYPKKYLTNSSDPSRLSIYPESYAWATWERTWQKYDDDLTWAKAVSLRDPGKVCGSTIGALRWKQNFADAASERIDTWAYRWLASMWEHELLMIFSNRNISKYEGWHDGTPTRIKPKWSEPQIKQILNMTRQ
jgi:hypothetical protein